jgi:hypothetical protein
LYFWGVIVISPVVGNGKNVPGSTSPDWRSQISNFHVSFFARHALYRDS